MTSLFRIFALAPFLALALAAAVTPPSHDEVEQVAGTACAARYLNMTGELPNGDFELFSFI